MIYLIQLNNRLDKFGDWEKTNIFKNCTFFILIKINLREIFHIHIYGTRPILYFLKVIEEGSQIGEVVIKVSK
jgi:hypothetical protein